MHGAADPVPSESIVDGVAQAVRLVHHRMADVPDRGPGADPIDPRPHHGFRVADQLQILRTRSADDEGDTGVGHPALDLDGEIQGDQVTGLEHAVVRPAVQSAVIDRGADHIPEGGRPECRVVVDVAAGPPDLADLPMGFGVDVQEIPAHIDRAAQMRQHGGDELTGRPSLLEGAQFRDDVASATAQDHRAAPAPGAVSVTEGRLACARLSAGSWEVTSRVPTQVIPAAKQAAPSRWKNTSSSGRPVRYCTYPITPWAMVTASNVQLAVRAWWRPGRRCRVTRMTSSRA